ncbi:uncharacterized protein LOC118976690 [Sturnira hondurensis]|uniref:uncharacterized protein LOC118976690 n=1 Tax=Sturnira hondurensis TaxID=192404 RepID=UPI00187AEFE3|nr:uncharacterized protein LOC118976690 [Sturnira hondurensis]
MAEAGDPWRPVLPGSDPRSWKTTSLSSRGRRAILEGELFAPRPPLACPSACPVFPACPRVPGHTEVAPVLPLNTGQPDAEAEGKDSSWPAARARHWTAMGRITQDNVCYGMLRTRHAGAGRHCANDLLLPREKLHLNFVLFIFVPPGREGRPVDCCHLRLRRGRRPAVGCRRGQESRPGSQAEGSFHDCSLKIFRWMCIHHTIHTYGGI